MSDQRNLRDELHQRLPASLTALIEDVEDMHLASFLVSQFPNQADAIRHNTDSWKDYKGKWLETAVFFLQYNPQATLALLYDLYEVVIQDELDSQEYIHKGLHLFWISLCYFRLDCPVHAKRYMMLSLIEDAIADKGNPLERGTAFQLTWQYGLSKSKIVEYSTCSFEIFQELNQSKGGLAFFPEWILLQLDQDWITELPSPVEAFLYRVNSKFLRTLVDYPHRKLGEGQEYISQYILSCMPGCRLTRRKRSSSTDYDLVASVEGFDIDFRSELGRYFVCECKDIGTPADFSTVAKFCRVLDSVKSRFGILFSTKGITGNSRTTDASREILKVYQDRGIVIVVIDRSDLEVVMDGANFINLLREKYESIRLDLRQDVIEPKSKIRKRGQN